MFENLRMGVHLCTETNVSDVPHCFTTEIPTYTLEVLNKLTEETEEWIFFSNVPCASLDRVVESMHQNYFIPVRLMENGFPVFTVWGISD